jgi:hypothetical protein
MIRFLPPVNQSYLKTIFLDVGLNRGKVASVWLRQVPHMHVIGVGIEANHNLVHDFESTKQNI